MKDRERKKKEVNIRQTVRYGVPTQWNIKEEQKGKEKISRLLYDDRKRKNEEKSVEIKEERGGERGKKLNI